MTISSAGIKTTIRAGEDGVHVAVGPERLAEAGVDSGEVVVVEVRRTTRDEWIAVNAGRVYEGADDMDRAINELRGLPE